MRSLCPSHYHKGCWDQPNLPQGVAQGSSQQKLIQEEHSFIEAHPCTYTFSNGPRKSTGFKACNDSKWSGWLPSIWFRKGIHQLAGNTTQIPSWLAPRRSDAFEGTVYRAEGFVCEAHQQPNYSSAFPLETASSASEEVNYIHAPFISTNLLISLPLPSLQDYQRGRGLSSYIPCQKSW